MLLHGCGNLSYSDSEGRSETDIGVCPHCQCVIDLQEWRKARGLGENGWCRHCAKPICPSCTVKMATHGCTPFVKWVENFLSEQHAKSQFRKLAGLE